MLLCSLSFTFFIWMCVIFLPHFFFFLHLYVWLLLRRFSRVRLCDPRDSSPPGSLVPWILQARALEWVAISFSNAWKWKAKVKSLSRAQLLVTPWTAAHQPSPSRGFSRQEYWSGGVPLPSPICVVRMLWIKYAVFVISISSIILVFSPFCLDFWSSDCLVFCFSCN